MKYIALAVIRFYQYAISPHFPPVCRFHPTCSAYAWEAVNRYGFLRGSLLAVRRIIRCHPFNRGGYDPVPDLTPFSVPLGIKKFLMINQTRKFPE